MRLRLAGKAGFLFLSLRGFGAAFRLSKWEEKFMTAYRTNHLYETNLMSNSAADTAPRMMTRKDAPTMCMVCREEVKMIAAESRHYLSMQPPHHLPLD